MNRWIALAAVILMAGPSAAGAGEPPSRKPHRLPTVDLKQRVIWGATCAIPDGTGLAFGGQDQEADDGRPHTRVLRDGRWVGIRDDLRAANPLRRGDVQVRALARRQQFFLASARATYFRGLGSPPEGLSVLGMLARDQKEVQEELRTLIGELQGGPASATGAASVQARTAAVYLGQAEVKVALAAQALSRAVTPAVLKAMHAAQVATELAADALGAEPPPRALSPLVHEPASGLYVLFGGDHLDYLTNDTWVFDPKAQRWTQRHPAAAPPPRANHTLKATADGKAVLSGGYTYASNTDYCGGQYVDLDDGPWTYDVSADAWSGPADGVPPGSRVYRTGPFHPDHFLEGPPPDAASHEKVLADIPINRWVLLKPPRVPRQNRDWGTVRLDSDRDQILVWSGGHSAHGGTDVLHYHLGTNRWELPCPVAFPLGQLYANTAYPEGYTFNRRPWPTGHTYQNYVYDPLSKKLLFAGRQRYTYVYDPDVADWIGRFEKPPGMIYNSCFYTLTLEATPRGVFCWGEAPNREGGLIHRFDATAETWRPVEVQGHLPEPVVDFSTMVYDARRDRFLMLRTPYGKKPDGQVYELDLNTMRARALDPVNRQAAASRGHAIDRACYVPGADLVLLCALLPGDGDGLRRHIAYDGAGNRWVSLTIEYERGKERPLAPTAVHRSVGLVYDARRNRLWGVDTNRLRVFVLRFDPDKADVQPL